MDWLYTILITIAIGGLALAGSVTALRAIRAAKVDATPDQMTLLGVLETFVWQAIFAGEKAALFALDDIGTKLNGVDRKAIADRAYDTLPDNIVIGDKTYSIGFVKMIVTREAWENFVAQKYNEALARFMKNRDYLQKQVDALQTQTTTTAPAVSG